MIDQNSDIIYNKDYLVIVPKMTHNLLDSFSYSFGNTVLMDNSVEAITKMINFINKNNFKQIILVDYQPSYEELITNLSKKHLIKAIYTKPLGAFSDSFILSTFYGIHKLYENNVVEELAFLDKNLYEVLKNKGEKVSFLMLDIKKCHCDEKFNKNRIGLLNSGDNTKHSFYNELSAIKLSNKYIAKIPYMNNVTKNFIKLFNIQKEKVNPDILYEDNLLNLYINFTDNDPTIFLRSMDKHVPCILGNTNLLDENKKLKNLLVMKSDDDIDEMVERIELVSKNRKEILLEYNKYRTTYIKKSKESIEKFLGNKKDVNQSDSNDLLLSVIVPVYNVEQYLQKSLDSIIKASIDKMEILIINDGSSDNSEEIIKKYLKSYPNLIRYIKQENHGLGNVRNVGLKEARGKYIASIDSDDTVNINFFKESLGYLEDDIDVVIYDWLTITNTNKFETAAIDWVFNNNNWNRYEGLLYTTIMPSTCNKIIKKSLFKKLDIKYLEDKYEDLSTNPFILLKAQTIKYINKPYYEYFIRSNSIMRTSAGLSMINVIKLVEERLKKYNAYINVNLDDFKYYTYSWRIEEYIMNQLYTLKSNELSNFIKYINDNIRSIMLEIFNNPRYFNMLNKLDEKDKEYILKRNKAYQDNKLEQFIKQVIKDNDYFKLTPPIIYYGKEG